MNFVPCSMHFCVVQEAQTTDRAKATQDTLAAEWESFEKLVEAGNDEQSRAAATEQDGVSLSSSDRLKKSAIATGGHATNQPLKKKRLFREAQLDSDGNGSSDSEDESYPILQSAVRNSGSSNKIDRRSSSSDSSQYAENKPTAKLASSDSDSSSDDEKHTAQTNLPLGKYCMSVVCTENQWSVV